ncbi:non-structural maintenance of chromosomes element 4 homolog A [Thunnus thynnus]|uniref:non-structural maintenance of chromosomes element 4 homolog A n=1 Tax=Thunnus maccoyii TaxID=8240 RepID=UPI001C4C5909|nr:non-structural maintenance of chromosomes element 4 homolog A [Thunnus maccoyii]XP_042290029.1 non-structural maintenance of chromosomes element 4 homolog A [Thunnus maccoyii]XP_042290030.1 non-structural maintenance of chromosomes element 4 homolog A [Thunnus maccoyii]XP_042290031.1 non-structural maintenance of chromosomes element 4 homolog A [Thunnus maccoyii]XP_042290033.1 non-structural maintenance of chromosomes element 4 homolog A [Thunnus maccoyii]XP_042290034.1 non-structural maint|eukprot:superscaffoldBa00002913_g15635
MRPARGGGDEEAPRQNGASGRRKGDQQQRSDGDDGGSAFSPADLLDEDNDPGLRREIRSKYRDLINSVQQNREDMLSPSNNKLTEVLEEANELFKDVRQVREAALDAQLLVMATDLGKEKASQLFSESSTFDPTAFAEHLLSFMGLNRLENGESEQQNGGAVDGYLPQDAWHRVAQRAACCFRTAPSFHYMMGSFHAEPPPPKQRTERQSKAPSKEAKRIMPTQLKKMEESHQEATEKEVERILGYLKSYYQDDPTSPISYYEFVIDPNSFSRTVENIFHTSFLIRDGLARMYLDSAELPCIAPVEEGEVQTEGSCSRKQCIVSISPKTWKELIDAFDIRDTIILPPNTQNE